MKDLGAATQADVLKAEVDDSRNQLAVLQNERDLQIAKATLASYLGRDPREPLELAPEEPELGEVMPLEDAIGQALQKNENLAASRTDLQASRASVRAAKSDRLPSFSLNGSTSYFNTSLGSFDDEHTEWQYGISMNFTVFDGLLTKGSIRRAEAQLLKAQRGAEAQERDVILAVRQAWLDLEIARRTIDVGERAVKSSEEDQRLAGERYRLGEGTILDVIDAQVNLTRSRTDLVSARFDARLAQSRLRSAVGNLTVPAIGE
jgi:outer membrane protein TolC